MIALLRSVTSVLVVKIMGAIVAFLLNMVVARRLGTSGTGAFYMVQTVVMVATVFGLLGMENPTLRLVASESSRAARSGVLRVVRLVTGVSLVASLAVSGVLVMTAPLIFELLGDPTLVTPVRVLIGATPAIALSLLAGEVLKGLRRPVLGALAQSVLTPMFAVVSVLVVGNTVGSVIWAYLGATWLTAGVAAIFVWGAIRKVGDADVGTALPVRKLLEISMPLLLVTGLSRVFGWANVFAIGFWGGTADVGVFSTAFRTANLLSFVLVAVNSVVAPKFATLYGQGKAAELQRLSGVARMMAFVLALPALIAILFWSESIMGVFGDEFRGGSAVLVVLGIGQTVNVAVGPMNKLLLMSGREITVRNIVACTVIVHLILLRFLVPEFGIMGAAIASAVAMGFQNIVAFFSARHVVRGLVRGS